MFFIPSLSRTTYYASPSKVRTITGPCFSCSNVVQLVLVAHHDLLLDIKDGNWFMFDINFSQIFVLNLNCKFMKLYVQDQWINLFFRSCQM